MSVYVRTFTYNYHKYNYKLNTPTSASIDFLMIMILSRCKQSFSRDNMYRTQLAKEAQPIVNVARIRHPERTITRCHHTPWAR
jgi:hypothetical protein